MENLLVVGLVVIGGCGFHHHLLFVPQWGSSDAGLNVSGGACSLKGRGHSTLSEVTILIHFTQPETQ